MLSAGGGAKKCCHFCNYVFLFICVCACVRACVRACSCACVDTSSVLNTFNSIVLFCKIISLF